MGLIYTLLPLLVNAYAEYIVVDYSKQPPRDLQLSAGTAMAIAGFIVTFLVLGIFTVLIKIIAVLGQRYEARKASLPAAAVTAAPQPALTPLTSPVEDYSGHAAAAAAVAAIIAREKASIARRSEGGADAWVLGERVSPPGKKSVDELSLRETERWRRS